VKQELWTLEKVHEMSKEEKRRRKKSEKRWARRIKKKTMRALEKAEREKQEEALKKMDLELKQMEKAREANEREFQETVNAVRKEKRLRAEAEEFVPEKVEVVEENLGDTDWEEKRRNELLEMRQEQLKLSAKRQLQVEAEARAELARREAMRIQRLQQIEIQRQFQLQQEMQRERILAEQRQAEAFMRQQERLHIVKAQYMQQKAEMLAEMSAEEENLEKVPGNETEEERLKRRLALHQKAHDAQLNEERIRRERNLMKKALRRKMQLQKRNARERVVNEFKSMGRGRKQMRKKDRLKVEANNHSESILPWEENIVGDSSSNSSELSNAVPLGYVEGSLTSTSGSDKDQPPMETKIAKIALAEISHPPSVGDCAEVSRNQPLGKSERREEDINHQPALGTPIEASPKQPPSDSGNKEDDQPILDSASSLLENAFDPSSMHHSPANTSVTNGGEVSSTEMHFGAEKVDDQNALDSASSLLESAYEPTTSHQATLVPPNSEVVSPETSFGLEKLDEENTLDSASSLLESAYEPTTSHQETLEPPSRSDPGGLVPVVKSSTAIVDVKDVSDLHSATSLVENACDIDHELEESSRNPAMERIDLADREPHAENAPQAAPDEDLEHANLKQRSRRKKKRRKKEQKISENTAYEDAIKDVINEPSNSKMVHSVSFIASNPPGSLPRKEEMNPKAIVPSNPPNSAPSKFENVNDAGSAICNASSEGDNTELEESLTVAEVASKEDDVGSPWIFKIPPGFSKYPPGFQNPETISPSDSVQEEGIQSTQDTNENQRFIDSTTTLGKQKAGEDDKYLVLSLKADERKPLKLKTIQRKKSKLNDSPKTPDNVKTVFDLEVEESFPEAPSSGLKSLSLKKVRLGKPTRTKLGRRIEEPKKGEEPAVSGYAAWEKEEKRRREANLKVEANSKEENNKNKTVNNERAAVSLGGKKKRKRRRRKKKKAVAVADKTDTESLDAIEKDTTRVPEETDSKNLQQQKKEPGGSEPSQLCDVSLSSDAPSETSNKEVDEPVSDIEKKRRKQKSAPPVASDGTDLNAPLLKTKSTPKADAPEAKRVQIMNRKGKESKENEKMEFEITMAELDAQLDEELLGNVDSVDDFSLEFLKEAQKDINKDDLYDRGNVKYVGSADKEKRSASTPVATKKVSAEKRRENIRSVWDRLTENAKGRSKFDKNKYRYPYRVVQGSADDDNEESVVTKQELFDMALKTAYSRGSSNNKMFLLGKTGFQELEDPIDFPTIDDRTIDPKYQRTKQDIKMALHLYQSSPSNTLESDLVANLEMLEIFDPFLADKMKYQHSELVELKDKVYEREKEPTEWNMWQLCNWLRKEKFSKWVVKKFEANDINGKTIHWFCRNRLEMASQLDLDEEICDEICDEIVRVTKERRRRRRRFKRSPLIVDFIRRTLPQLSQRKVLFYSKLLASNGVWNLEDLTKQVVWDKLEEIKSSHLIPLIQAAIRKVDDKPEELEFKLKHLRIEKEQELDNISVATGQSMSPAMLVSRRLLSEQWIANKFPDLWNKYPERGGKLGYVMVELKDTEKITKKQYRALNVLRYGGAIGAHYAPLSEYQTGQKGHMKAESDRSLKKLGLMQKGKVVDEETLLLQSNVAMNSLGLSDLDLVTHVDDQNSSDEEDERYLGDGLSLQCTKHVRFKAGTKI